LEQQAQEIAPKARVLSHLKYPLPDPDLSFQRHWEILKAYVLTSKEGKEPVSYKDFGNLTVSPNHISANNKFFESIGFISRAEGTHGKYVPTPAGIAIDRDLAWKKEANAKARLSELLAKSWFWQSAKNLLHMREKVLASDLVDQLGYDSGADPIKHKPALGVLIEYLQFSELIIDQDGSSILGPASSREKITQVESASRQGSNSGTEKQLRSSLTANTSIILGVLITPETAEDKIRKTIQIILEEIGRAT
jgi:hypothetical protein